MLPIVPLEIKEGLSYDDEIRFDNIIYNISNHEISLLNIGVKTYVKMNRSNLRLYLLKKENCDIFLDILSKDIYRYICSD